MVVVETETRIFVIFFVLVSAKLAMYVGVYYAFFCSSNVGKSFFPSN